MIKIISYNNLGEESNMHFCAGVKVEDHIYLIEDLSRCLISIYIPSGETKIEAYLPWRFTGKKIGLLSFDDHLFIYSPAIDQFLIFDRLRQHMRTIELHGMEVDEAGYYYSNVLIDKNELIVLPFKGKEIKRYGMDGGIREKYSQWCSAIFREYGYDEKAVGNIRMDSACIIEDQLLFSLIYGNKNYLCRYGLNQKEHLSNIIYCSGDVAVRGVYVYPDSVLFRRIFSDKTEIVMITPSFNVEKTIRIEHSSMFEEDLYGDICTLRGSFKNRILEINKYGSNAYQEIYTFDQKEVYIANGILFNRSRNEILVPDKDHVSKYPIEKVVREIKKSSFYEEGSRGLFGSKCIYEDKYRLQELMEYIIELPPMMIETSGYIKDKGIGKWIWETI